MQFEGAEKLLEVTFALPVLQHRSLLTGCCHGQTGWCDCCRRCSSPCSDSDSWDEARGADFRVLRQIPLDAWVEVLKLVKCKILSILHGREVDAYLLSESSLFIYDDRVIIKTCGTTALLLALPRILQIAHEFCKLPFVKGVFYSRRCFRFPEEQPWPHTSWTDELDVLKSTFESGSSYIMGNTSADHWYLFVAGHTELPLTFPLQMQAMLDAAQTEIFASDDHSTPKCIPYRDAENDDDDDNDDHEKTQIQKHRANLSPCATTEPGRQKSNGHAQAHQSAPFFSHVQKSIQIKPHAGLALLPSSSSTVLPLASSTNTTTTASSSPSYSDETLELIMSDLCAVQMRAFYAGQKIHQCDLAQPQQPPGILLGDACIPGLRTDSYHFDPCGWSQNGIINGRYYTTIHVTPEEGISYASFETSLPLSEQPCDLVPEILRVFGAENVTMTLVKPRKVAPDCNRDSGNKKNLLPRNDSATAVTSEMNVFALPKDAPDLSLCGYKLIDMMVNMLPDHVVFYMYFVRCLSYAEEATEGKCGLPPLCAPADRTGADEGFS